MYVNPILDEMNKNQNWVCPIQTVSSDSAFYSISNDSITLPLKSQFKDGESFYGTELHEMGHSTGVKNRLNRKGFYENDKFNYGREELVAELISALSGVYLGISVTVREENAAYLKSWCKAIKEEPKFLFTVLADAIKGSKFIAQHLNIRLDVEEVEEEKNTKVGEVVAIAQSYLDLSLAEVSQWKSNGNKTTINSLAGWTNKLFTKAELMPHHIRITNIKIEKLQGISDKDCLKEGIYKGQCGSADTHFMDAYYYKGDIQPYCTPREAFAALIDKVSGKGTWESNPYVFAYEFELID